MLIHCKGHGETCLVVAEMDQEVRRLLLVLGLRLVGDIVVVVRLRGRVV